MTAPSPDRPPLPYDPALEQIRPDEAKVTASPVPAVPPIRTLTVVPRASAICEATVRCQISS